jgi:hypothetical protein
MLHLLHQDNMLRVPVSHHELLKVSHKKMHKDRTLPPVTFKAPLSGHRIPPKQSPPTLAMSRRWDIIPAPGFPFERGVPTTDANQTQKKGSPTKSTGRARWANLHLWTSFEHEVSTYLVNLPYQDHAAIVARAEAVASAGDAAVAGILPTDEDEVADIFITLYKNLHNQCAMGPNAKDRHACLARRGNSGSAKVDYIFTLEPERQYVGVLEVKKFWAVTEEQILQVIYGMSHLLFFS